MSYLFLSCTEEHVLAHKLPDEVEAAYLRRAYLEKRKGLMADWAQYVYQK